MKQSILNQKQSQSGFTLVELIVVIVLLGILGVTALGKFQDLSGDAKTAVTNGIAAEISSSSSINYAKSLLGNPAVCIGDGVTTCTDGTAVDTATAAVACGALLSNLLTGGLPSMGGSTVTVGAGTGTTTNNCAANAGDSFSCTITGDGTTSSDFTVFCTE